MFSPEILDRIHADHARDQAEAKRAALSSDGIFERIEVGAENHKVSDEPFRQCITNSFLFGTGKKARASAAVLFFGFAALGSASVDPRCPSAFGPFGSSAPAGDRVVCLIDHDVPSQYELWSAPPATKLSQTIVRELPFDVIRFAVSPDGARVAYAIDSAKWTQYELFSVPTSGALPPVLHSGAMPFNADADDFLWSLDGARLIYRKGHNALGNWALWSSPCCGGISVQLSQAGGNVQPGFQIIGSDVRYQWGDDGSTYSWWLVPVAGGTPRRDDRIFNDGFNDGTRGGWR